ncbi:hypothetical protein I3842_03G057400 [Carya illinoinensis]|uniref:BHLH domain-containing protein n=2 Tax=Carya illinoinensis TaxID=32201 RepID=A0A922JX26_CARIL|nr:hypothetical protein I3842_03G057400 [Carya illinoinensis]
MTGFEQCFKPSIPYSDINTAIEMLSQFAGPSASIMEDFEITNFTLDNFLAYQQPEYQAGMAHSLSGTSHLNCQNELPSLHTSSSTNDVFHESKKRKVLELSTSSSESLPSAASRNQLKDNYSSAKQNSIGKGKKKSSENEQEKQEEVIHVRAKRGQATDSHSLAERVRRQKINYKLRCLQDLVPGCRKTMGMAAMLDEIINYVHSLKNQVEFLSTELTVACTHDLIWYTEAEEKAKGTNSHKVHEMENWEREQYGEQTLFHSTWPI